VERLACVDVPALPLQLLLQKHPSWRSEPVAVVDHDASHGTVLWVNEQARAEGVLPGASYSSALTLSMGLRATEVSEAEIVAGVQALADLLRKASPSVEPKPDEPGVYWVDVSGLERVHPSRIAWAKRLRATLLHAGFEGAVVVGWQRFSTYAVAKSLHGARVVVFEDPTKERAFASRVLLRRIGIEPRARIELEKLGLHTVGDLVNLPVESVAMRFGADVVRLHALASGELHIPLEPQLVEQRVQAGVDLDFPVANTEQVLCVVTELVQPLLAQLAERGQGARTLALRLVLEDQTEITEQVEFAEPTLDLAQVLRLLRLRLEQTRLARGADRVEVELHGAVATQEQLRLFAQRSGRDPRAAAQAFAALRAAFGDVVVRAQLVPAHLPEASFKWESIEEVSFPRPTAVASPPLVRRIHAKPLVLAGRGRHDEDGWMPRGLEHGSVERLDGPYLLSGGWWQTPVERDYYFAHLRNGTVLWIYFDRRRRRWYWQGTVS
jgi:protein ImuB